MSLSRRQFVASSAVGLAATCVPYLPAHGSVRSRGVRAGAVRLADPDVSRLALVAVDAAMSAGAQYADVKVTSTRDQIYVGVNPMQDMETRAIGVRALVNGFWGFSSNPIWTEDSASVLGKAAVSQAMATSRGKKRELDLGEAPPVVKDSWVMPVKYDPFEVSYGEKMDYIATIQEMINLESSFASAVATFAFQKQFKVVATSDGSLFDCTRYVSGVRFVTIYGEQYSLRLPLGGYLADFLSPAGKGWEYISEETRLIDKIPFLIEQAELSRHAIPADVGRYDAVFSAGTTASALNSTLGAALELDRAMGYEANAGGTSYLNKPAEMLGSHKVGSSLINLWGDNTIEGGLATAPYDDEAVKAKPFQLVKDGVVSDFQTGREQASWIADAYAKLGRNAQSNGCARSETGMQITTQLIPNLVLEGGKGRKSFDDLVSQVDRGIAVLSPGMINMDHQNLNGIMINPIVREIRGGKLGKFLRNCGIQFRSPELWANLKDLGDETTRLVSGMQAVKGQPLQSSRHSVSAVAGMFSNVSVVDVGRR